MPRFSRTPHCPSAWHQQLCSCGHARFVHQEEEEVCREIDCECVRFVLKPGYPEIEHTTLR